jgi:FtsZ-binding cell division protein ZapB
LLEKGERQGEFIYVKIVHELLRTFRENGFEVNDDKYLFLTSKVVQHMRLLQQERESDLRTDNAELTQTVSLQRQEIANLNEEIESLKQQLQAKRKRDLSIVIEEKEDTHAVKRSTS